MISLARYVAVLQARETRLTFAWSVIGRLPIGITGLAVLLLVHGQTGSFARGGTATAGYVAGLAVAAPVLGPVDRPARPAPGPLLASGLLFPIALVALVAAVSRDAPGWLTPLAAYSLQSILIELIFIAGPMLVAAFVAFASPAAAVWFAAACGGRGCGAVWALAGVTRLAHRNPSGAPACLVPLPIADSSR